MCVTVFTVCKQKKGKRLLPLLDRSMTESASAVLCVCAPFQRKHFSVPVSEREKRELIQLNLNTLAVVVLLPIGCQMEIDLGRFNHHREVVVGGEVLLWSVHTSTANKGGRWARHHHYHHQQQQLLRANCGLPLELSVPPLWTPHLSTTSVTTSQSELLSTTQIGNCCCLQC